MAQANVRPTVDLAAGRKVLAATLPRVMSTLGADGLDAFSWQMPNKNTLLIPMTGSLHGVSESYLLKLHFRTAADWPPSAQFVNPETCNYELGKDQHHLPNLQSPEAHVHPAYQAHGREQQLVCCSATFEFYDVLHSVEERHIWKATDTFLVTLGAIERAFAHHYHGRHAPNG